MDGEVGAQVSPPLFLQQGLPLGFHEAASLARKRDSAWQRGSFHHDQHQQQSQPQLSGSGYSTSYGSWNPKLWDWDSTRFVATPATNASEGLRPGALSEVTGMELKRNGEKGSKGAEDQGGDLTLKLGGGSYTVEESVARPNKRVRSGSPGNGGSYPMCQVDDCRADLSNAKDYHRRHKVCEVHSKTTKAMVGKHMQRFCQQCSRFHMLAEFDEGKRSCRRRLAGHNRRRRKTQPEDVSSRPIPPSNQENPGSANLNIVNLLTILAQLQGNGVDKPSSSSLPDKGRLVQVLGKINSLPSLDSSIKTPKAVDFDLNVSQTSQISFEHSSKTDGNLPAPLTMDLLAVLSAALKAPAVNNVADFSQGSSESSGNERTKVHPEEFVSDGNVQTKSPEFSSVAVGGSDCALQSSTEISEHSVNPSLRLQLLSSIEDDSPPEMGSSSKYQYAESRNPINNKSPSSSPPDLWRLFPLQSEAESFKHNQISIIRDHDGMIEASNKNEGRGSVLELSRHSGRRVENCTILSVPYQAGYTSSSGSDQSPSSSNSDSQERTGRIIFKLFGKDPSSFPVTLRMQILSWLSHSPSDMESYIRPGCVVLSVYLSMPSSAWDELQEDLIQRINLLVQHSDSDFWRNGRFLIYLDGQLASHKGGKIRLCRTWRTWRAPEIISVSPLAVVSGREISLVLRGRNLNVPGTKIHCTYMGCYTSKEVPMSSEPGRIYDDSSIECFNFPGGAPSAFGRCFLEVENGFKGNSFPVIIADDKICQELRHLESEFENDVKSSDIMQEDQVYDCARRQSREDVLHFLNELGWLFQRSSIESYPLLENFSNARFKFLFIFAVERDWTALIRKLLDILVERSSRNVELVQESLETLSEIQLLHRAVKRKCRKMVDLLLHYSVSHGIDSSKLYLFLPNTVGPGGVTPLHLAASTQDSEDIVDGLTDDPQEIGLNCWSSVVDGNGQSPYTYALMRNNHSYNKLVSRKLADRRNDQVSITVESEMDLKKPESSREVEKPKLGSLDTMCSRCAIMERRRIKTTLRPQGLLRYPFLNPILGIAAVCLCVCLIIRGAPEMGPVAPFKWENLDFGTS
ncbi:hypothetical protein Taro_031166 [Colocasia esculenta]|uniref:SBP-type domain-containing protein n=1 Tax=Colocasia esculenta TaxID=4460 RepID=A0A843W2C3_COLES|nr:hypothetical protein [Colocasia esculenta]